MATTYKNFLNDDVINTRTLLHEAIPITGSIVADSGFTGNNIKNYAHGRFQSVYDYPWLSASSNHIFDLTCGYSSDSSLENVGNEENSQKKQMYNQMAQMLVGHDVNGNILKFDEDGDLLAGGNKISEAIFFSFSRLLVKDEIKKGTFNLSLGIGTAASPLATVVMLQDTGAESEYRVNSPAGEYGILYNGLTKVGHVFYQAGIVVLNKSVFTDPSFNAEGDIDDALQNSTIQELCDSIRSRISKIDFNNTVELNSTIYFCRINHNEFNYSSNPTYLNESKIRVKQERLDSPTSYITTVGLYSTTNELLAVAKLSEPLKKTPENELILRVRLDY